MDAPITTTPRGLADTLATLADAVATDQEVTTILVTARQSLEALSWNRYAHSVNARSRRSAMKRRHQGHGGHANA